MFSKKARVSIRLFHKWVAVIIGIQLSLWIISGVYFAWISIEDVRGDSQKIETPPQGIILSDLVAPDQPLLPKNSTLKSLKLDPGPKGYCYRLELTDGTIESFDAKTGQRMDILSVDKAKTLALSQVKGSYEGRDISLLREKSNEGEYKGPVPVYRIELKDSLKTRLYIDPWSGKLIVQRNMLWRVYDFLWMLHIMDYKSREDFNNPVLRVATAAAMGIIISGYLLFAFGRIPRRKKVHSAPSSSQV